MKPILNFRHFICLCILIQLQNQNGFGQCTTPTITANGATTFCLGGSVTLSANAGWVVSTFAGSGPGSTPYADGTGTAASFYYPYGLAIGPNDTIYVADTYNHRIRKITPYGAVTTLAGSGDYNFVNGNGLSASFRAPAGVAVDATGVVYVADTDNLSIRKITANGNVSTFAGRFGGHVDGQGGSARFNHPFGVAVDKSGNIYISDTSNDCIRKITPQGLVSTFAGAANSGYVSCSGCSGYQDGPAITAKFFQPYGIAVDKNDNVYVADLGNNVIRKITQAGMVSTFAGSGIAGYADGIGTAAAFHTPFGLAFDSVNNLYVTEQNNIRVRKISPSGEVSTIAGNGTQSYLDGNGLNAAFYSPTGIGVNSKGDIFVCDGFNNLIRKITQVQGIDSYLWSNGATTQNITVTTSGTYSLQTISGGCTSVASSPITVTVNTVPTASITAGGPATFCSGGSVTLTASGGTSYLWNDGSTANPRTVSTSGTYTVQAIGNGCTSAASAAKVVSIKTTTTPAISANGATTFCLGGSVTLSGPGKNINATVTTLAGYGTPGFADGPGADAHFYTPTGLATDGKENVYVADQYTGRIRKIDPTGIVSTLAGNGAFGFADGRAVNAEFNIPTGVATDAAGNVYVADRVNNRIRKIDPTGNVSTVAGNGNFGFMDGPALNAEFNGPNSVATDLAGNLYVADQNNHRIRKIGPNGMVSTLAGSGFAGFADGAGANAQFNNPSGVATDAYGNLYVADYENHRIRKIDNYGNVSTIAGNRISGFINGSGANASFNYPTGVATDLAGNVYVADYNNHCIRKIDPAGNVSTLAGSGLTGFADGSATIARFTYPFGVATDANENVYVSDSNFNRIRKITQVQDFDSYLWSNGATTQNITVTTSGTYSLQTISGGCTSVASSPITVTVNTCGNYWTGATSNVWEEFSNWSGGSVPPSNSDIAIPPCQRNPVIGSDVSLKNLTISQGVGLSINGTLQVSGNLVNNGSLSGSGTLKLSGTTAQSIDGNAFDISNLSISNGLGATLHTNVGVIGTVNLQTGILNANGHLIIRSNANGTGLIDDFSAGNTGKVLGQVSVERYFPVSGTHLVAAPVTGSRLGTVGLSCSNIRFWSEALNVGVVATTGCESTSFDVNTPLAVTQNSGTKYTLSGTANTGDYTVNLVRGAGSSPQRGFNYVANPYPSPISWTSVIATSGLTANSNGTAYIWNPATSTYGSVSSAGVVTGSASNLIQSGQGLIVRRSTVGITGATMTFKNSQRVNTNSAFFIRKPATDQALRLVLKSNNLEDEILLYTSPEANVDADNLDAEKLHSHLPVASISSGNDLAINALPTDFTGTVSLNISALNAGVYHLSVKELGEVSVTLEDKKTGTFTVLTPETKLDLNLNESNQGRFALHYGSNSVGLNNTQIFAADKLVTVIVPTDDNAVIEAVNTLGQVVGTVNSTDKVTRFALPRDGVYVIRVKSGNGVKSGKVIY